MQQIAGQLGSLERAQRETGSKVDRLLRVARPAVGWDDRALKVGAAIFQIGLNLIFFVSWVRASLCSTLVVSRAVCV